MRASIYLRTGQIVEVGVESITKVKNPMGELAGFKWENVPAGPDARELFYLNVDQVDAVVVRDTEDPQPALPPVKM